MDSSKQNYNPSDNNNNNPPKNIQQKKGKGRKKTTNEKIESESKRQVSFSKRRPGLFKKANEIGTLCSTENVVVVHSPSGKIHSFGSPNVERVAHRFLDQTERVHGEMLDDTRIRQLDEELTNLERQLSLEKQHAEESTRMQDEMKGQEGIPPHLDDLDFQQLDGLMSYASSVQMEFELGNLDHAAGPSTNSPLGPVFPGGYSNYPNQIDIGSGSNNNSNVVFTSNATLFTANTNHDFVFPVASNLDLPFRYPHLATGSSSTFSFNYGDAPDLFDGENQRGRNINNGRGRGSGSGSGRGN